nr:MAG TPA: hypothetical protein [Caudoviricetes sp.]
MTRKYGKRAAVKFAARFHLRWNCRLLGSGPPDINRLQF